MSVLTDDLGGAAHGARHAHRGVRHRARQEPQQALVARPHFVQQRRHPEVLDVVIGELQLPPDRRRHVGHPVGVPLLVPLGGFDVIGQKLECREIRVLHLGETHRPLLGEAAHHVARKDEEAGPRYQREQRVGVESGQHVQTHEVLVVEDERHHEYARHDREASAAVEAGEHHRQIVEAQEGELLVHEGVNRRHREHQKQYEDPLEVAEEEQLGALQGTRLSHEIPRA